MFKNCTIINKQTGEIFEGQLDTELENLDSYPLREATAEEIKAEQVKKDQLEAYQVYQDKLINLKLEDEFNLFLLKTTQISQQDYDSRLSVITADLITAKNEYLGVE